DWSSGVCSSDLNRDSNCEGRRDVDDARPRSRPPGSRKVTQWAKGLRQFVMARQQTQAEQVVAQQVWRLVALQRSQAKPTHLRRAAQQLESAVRVARPVWRFA